MKDKCVNCKKETLYQKEEHVKYRLGYIEGIGQLCLDCWEVIHGIELKNFNNKGTKNGTKKLDGLR
ncbi:hypothetical protein HOE22_07900 [Candidatus Woesearchaeota archaeon]|jgi:hypothetical protein|nr:hypothetical protein [Candidatus Woesearchaeota archaeon]MBT7556998.1 hypothetical protein [Candidatus Woesearchaeota archaeon]